MFLWEVLAEFVAGVAGQRQWRWVVLSVLATVGAGVAALLLLG